MQSTIGSTRELVSLVNLMGICYLFKRTKIPRLYDMVKGVDSTERRGLLLRLCEGAHLKGNIFLTVDEGGSLLVMSVVKFRELYPIRTCIRLTKDEKRILGTLRHATPTPEIRRRAGLSARRFNEALLGLRFKMRITLVGVTNATKTKHVNLFANISEKTFQYPNKNVN